MDLIINIIIILLASVLIFYIGNIFAKSSSKIGDYLNLPRSVKGATFDAIASSLPELLVALFAVVFFKKFEVGIGTIAGSALFNLLIIPGICVLVAPVAFKVSKKVISRDAMFYIIAVFALLVTLIYFKVWGMMIAIIFLLIYLIYVREIVIHSRRYRRENKKKDNNIKILREIVIFLLTMGGIGVVTYFLTMSSINLSEILNISPIIIAFTITAAATSVPDAVISISNARKGDLDDAVSNVFGSNIFDIFVGLGLPLLIYSVFVGSVKIGFEYLEIILGLLGATIILLYFFAEEEKLTKKQGIFLLFMYFIFLAYIIFLSFV